MKRYAQLENNIVQNVIESETDPDGINGEWIECGAAGPGFTYDGTAFSAPVIIPEVNPTEFLIDKGSFFDRFGVTKLDVLKSTNVTIKAILLDISNRQWIDLKNPDVSGSLALIGTYVTSVTPELQDTILNSPVLPLENLALRKLYF